MHLTLSPTMFCDDCLLLDNQLAISVELYLLLLKQLRQSTLTSLPN
jgi:hypothetical protein